MADRPDSPPPRSSHGCFVTGTDTGVGKTVVTAALAVCLKRRGRSVGVMKPVETGHEEGRTGRSDAERLRASLGVDDLERVLNPYRFAAPLAPLAAARQAGAAISLDLIVAAYGRLAARYRSVLVEGAGGLLVPLTEQEDVRDLIGRLALPAVLVGRSGLGGINQALLTIEALRARRIPLLALVLTRQGSRGTTANDGLQTDSTVEWLTERSGVPVIGPLPYLADVERDWMSGVSELAGDPGIEALADLVSRDGP